MHISILAEDTDDVLTPPPAEPNDIIELQLRPHPSQTNVDSTAIRNLVTSSVCTITHLIRYMGLNLNEEGEPVRGRGHNGVWSVMGEPMMGVVYCDGRSL